MGGRGKRLPKLPNYKNAEIARNKLKNYLLNPKKSNGKFAFFKSLGYNMKNFRRLERDIRSEISKNEAFMTITNRYGHEVKVYDVYVNIGLNKKAIVLTSWQTDHGTNIPRFITAYPNKKKVKQ